MKKYLILLVLVLISSACRKNHLFIVNGTVTDSIRKNIYLQRIDVISTVLIDSSKIDRKGSFRFRVKTTEPDFYQVGYSDKDFVTLLAEPGEKIQLDFHGQNLSDNYTISGSKGSELIQVLDLQLIKTKNKLDSISTAYVKAGTEPDPETKKSVLEQEYLNLLKEQRKFNIVFIINNINLMKFHKWFSY